MERRRGGDFERIGRTFGISPILARIIRNRDIEGDEAYQKYLHGTLKDLHDPHLLGGVEDAAQLLKEKVAAHEKIRIIGDYDIDGVNSVYILYDALSRLGADVDYEIPDRMSDGYGLNRRLIEHACEDGVDTILTCDNGISAVEQIRMARRLGMTVIVTDHHEPPYEQAGDEINWLLPAANVLIDPKLPDDPYPFEGICGAVVAWKLVQVLFELCGRDAGECMDYLPYAAFATVGDVMDLRDENRIIVRFGLRALQKTENAGLRALIRVTGLSGKELSAYHIGFVLGPCMNAAGRLETAKLSLQLLLCAEDEKEKAERLALELVALNEERKDMTAQQIAEADKALIETGMVSDPVYCIYLPRCHESIAGIVAGRVREKYNHPTLVMTDSQTAGELKGSGRSIEEYPMFDRMVSHKELFLKFGGHAMAAGFSLKKENLEKLRGLLNEDCGLTKQDLLPKIRFDAVLPIRYLSEPVIEQLSLLEPCGKGNEKPLFAVAGLRILQARLLGKNKNVVKFLAREKDSGVTMDALYFGDTEELTGYLETKYGQEAVRSMWMGRESGISLTVTYYPDINEYMGRRSMQLVIRNYR